MESNQTFSITLKHGELFISVSQLISELATHFHSISEPSQLRIYQIEKSWKIGEQGYIDNLSSTDWKVLDNVSKKAGLDKFRYGITDDECSRYNDALNSSEEKLNWKLTFRAFIPSNKKMAAKIILENIRESKDIVNFTPDLKISNREIDYDSFMSISDAKAWLDSWGISTKEEPSLTTPIIDSEENNTPPLPGEMPKNEINRIAVKAAWQIEIKLKRYATKHEVIELLAEWTQNGSHEGDGILNSYDKKKGINYYVTSKCENKYFSLDACSKTLSRWNKSREKPVVLPVK